jgi:DNA-binding MarR family transcriptional regulator
VRLTPRGREAVDTALANLLERERRLLAMLDQGERARLGELLRSVLEPLDAERPAPADAGE